MMQAVIRESSDMLIHYSTNTYMYIVYLIDLHKVFDRYKYLPCKELSWIPIMYNLGEWSWSW